MSRIINFWSLSFCPPSCFLSATEILFSNLYFMSWVVSPLFFDMLLKILTPWSVLLVSFLFHWNALWAAFHGEHRAVDDMVLSSYLGKRKYFKMCFIKMYYFYLLLYFWYVKSEKGENTLKIIMLVFTNHKNSSTPHTYPHIQLSCSTLFSNSVCIKKNL